MNSLLNHSDNSVFDLKNESAILSNDSKGIFSILKIWVLKSAGVTWPLWRYEFNLSSAVLSI